MHLALAALLLRALVPAGMMAAPVANGWLFQLCPQGMAMSSYMALLGAEVQSKASDHSGHSGHSDHSDHSDHATHSTHDGADFDPACGLNAGFVAITFEADEPLALRSAEQNLLARLPESRLPRAPPRANRSRAPPNYS